MLLEGMDAPSRQPLPLVAQCGTCRLNTTCNTPKMPVYGSGRKGILVIGDYPGERDDATGVPFSGDGGRLLRDSLSCCGVDLQRDCYATFSRICRPYKRTKANRQIHGQIVAKSLKYCRPNVMRAIRDTDPTTIILVGIDAVNSLIGWDWKEGVGAMDRWAGWAIPDQRRNVWICPVDDPAYILGMKSGTGDAARLWFDRHIAAAVSRDSRPWKAPPQWKRKLRVEMSPDAAAAVLRSLSGPIAFDYETDRIKPDDPAARILIASASDGKTTVSFPWHGAAIDAMRDILFSDVPKIAHNAKFESRWTRRQFGGWIRNLAWCTMQAAHLIDNRRGVVGLKFQAYVRLGAESYDDALKPYMDGNGGNDRNRLDKVDTRKLLEYGGLDSLYTWKLAKIQREELGYKGW